MDTVSQTAYGDGLRERPRVALVTGPSGAGKSYLQNRLVRESGDRLLAVCTDALFREATRIALPLLARHCSVNSVLEATQSLPIDWTESIRRTAWELRLDPGKPLVVAGIHLRNPRWRGPLLEGLGVSPERETRMFVILPPAEALLAQRQQGHEFHRRHASLAACLDCTMMTERLLLTSPPGCAVDRVASSDEAIIAIRRFLLGPSADVGAAHPELSSGSASS